MNKPDTQSPRKTPQMISAFTEGFSTVTTHIWLIILPLLLDIYLWFGPHLRVKSLFLPYLSEIIGNFRAMPAANISEMVTSIEELWKTVLEHYNIFGSLHTFPIGLTSLLSAQGPLSNPLGSPLFVELNSMANFIGVWIILVMVGLILGSTYFGSIARAINADPHRITFGELGWQTLQSLLLSISILVVLAFLTIPFVLILSVVAVLSGFLAQLIILFFTLILIWFLTPLVFSPHGIFLNHQNILLSMLTSVRLVRFFLPGTGLFILMAIILNEGLNTLWRVPQENSWLTLIGIAGHAFTSTSLLAASFAYYKLGIQKMQAAQEKIFSQQP